jgi:hypothetical protein
MHKLRHLSLVILGGALGIMLIAGGVLTLTEARNLAMSIFWVGLAALFVGLAVKALAQRQPKVPPLRERNPYE